MITAQVEDATPQLVGELAVHFQDHWRELAIDQEKVPLDVNWHWYAQMQAAGKLFVVTLRDEGSIVGYFVGIVDTNPHYQHTLILKMDIFWTHPSIRGGTAGLRLFRAVEREARRRGIKRMYMGSKLHKDSGRLFEAMGYMPTETYYSKWIGE